MSSNHEYALQPGWALAPLNTLGEWSGGGTPSKSRAEYWEGGVIPWVSPKDMKRLRIDDAEDHITEQALETSVKLIPPRSVLMVTRSGILSHTFPVAISLVPVTVNQDIKALTPATPLDAFYIGYGLTAFGQSILHDCSKDGTTVASVETDALKNYQVPIAPLPEQQRVVQAIESYLSRLDDAVATLERVQRNLKRYRASVLKAAVEGSLVPTEAELARKEGRDYEPADVLLARILKERKARWIEQETEKGRARAEGKAAKAGKPWTKAEDETALAKSHAVAAKKYKEPAPPNTSELQDLPEGWCWATVETQYDVAYGLSESLRKTEPQDRDDLPVLRIPNITTSGSLSLKQLKYFAVETKTRPKLLLRRGDLLFNWRNAPAQIGRTAVFDVPGDFVNASFLLRMRPYAPALDGRFLWIYLNQMRLTGYFVLRSRAAVNQSNFNASETKALVVPLPPLAEQCRMLESVQREWSRVDHLSELVASAERRVSVLRQAVLKWAFEGKLVDQDPNDEPASVLLERIKAERETARAAARAKKKPARKPRKKKPA